MATFIKLHQAKNQILVNLDLVQTIRMIDPHDSFKGSQLDFADHQIAVDETILQITECR